jgi:hypothetical protein
LKYSVEIKETLSRRIEIEAATRNEAQEIAKQLYREEKIVLTADDFTEVNFATLYN